MPRVTILRREPTILFPGPRQAEEVVEVTFVTDVQGVSTVTLPLASYRPATDEERAANVRYRMLPVDKAAEAAERKAVDDALKRTSTGPPVSFDLP